MRKQFFITTPQNETYLLYTKTPLGLFLRKNTQKAYKDSLLYERCSKDIDVCFFQNEIYILCQDSRGNIVAILKKDNDWQKFDVMADKAGAKFYKKSFEISGFGNKVYGFFNMPVDGDDLLFACDINDLKTSSVISDLKYQDQISFSVCKISENEAAAVFLDKKSMLGLKIFNSRLNKCTYYLPIFECESINSLKSCFFKQKLHIIFNRGNSLFYIVVDPVIKIRSAIYDLGSMENTDSAFISPSKNDIKIYLISQDNIQINIFDANSKIDDYKSYPRIKEEIIDLKKIDQNAFVNCLAVYINGRHIDLYSFLNKEIQEKSQNEDDENLETKLMDLTRQIEDIKRKMK